MHFLIAAVLLLSPNQDLHSEKSVKPAEFEDRPPRKSEEFPSFKGVSLAHYNLGNQEDKSPPGIESGSPGAKKETVEVIAPLLPEVKPILPQDSLAPSLNQPADRWLLMKALQGTYYGTLLDDNRLYLNGWVGGSANASTSSQTNLMVTWNDVPNNFLLQQGWVRMGRSVVTSGTTDPTFGFQLDLLGGSDYRATLPRGFFNSQLLSSRWDPATNPGGFNVQNLYGFDLVQQYVNAYVPDLFRGTEFRIGRVYTPWGVESIEMVSTPLISRSYGFDWCPPFTHCGVAAYITLDSEWSTMLMAANGNDVYWGDPSAEWRFVGNLKWVQPGGGKNTVVLATSVGRGKFDSGDVFNVPGWATIDEAGGRTNMNVFDIVWTHSFHSRLSYALESIYGYQTNVPAIYNAAGYGTAHWFSVCHYLFWNLDAKTTFILRYENFDDLQGQRTGFEALYTSATACLSYKVCKDMILRSELRYDIANTGTPFDNGTKNQVLVGSVDLTMRW